MNFISLTTMMIKLPNGKIIESPKIMPPMLELDEADYVKMITGKVAYLNKQIDKLVAARDAHLLEFDSISPQLEQKSIDAMNAVVNPISDIKVING